jgi:hypothetical protein
MVVMVHAGRLSLFLRISQHLVFSACPHVEVLDVGDIETVIVKNVAQIVSVVPRELFEVVPLPCILWFVWYVHRVCVYRG